MKYFYATIVLVVWLIVTLLLGITVIGLIVVLEEGWMKFPNKIFTSINKNDETPL